MVKLSEEQVPLVKELIIGLCAVGMGKNVDDARLEELGQILGLSDSDEASLAFNVQMYEKFHIR